MSQTPHIPSTSAGSLRPARSSDAAKTPEARPAFEALLERLTSRAAELEEKSKTLDAPDELPGAVDAARASLEDALQLGSELLEAYRASRSSSPEVQP